MKSAVDASSIQTQVFRNRNVEKGFLARVLGPGILLLHSKPWVSKHKQG
jgi:hypothetical protein